MQESGDRIDLTLFTVCVRCGVVDNGPRRLAGSVNTTMPCKCIVCVLNWLTKGSTQYSFEDMRTLLLHL